MYLCSDEFLFNDWVFSKINIYYDYFRPCTSNILNPPLLCTATGKVNFVCEVSEPVALRFVSFTRDSSSRIALYGSWQVIKENKISSCDGILKVRHLFEFNEMSHVGCANRFGLYFKRGKHSETCWFIVIAWYPRSTVNVDACRSWAEILLKSI